MKKHKYTLGSILAVIAFYIVDEAGYYAIWGELPSRHQQGVFTLLLIFGLLAALFCLMILLKAIRNRRPLK